MPRDLFAQVCNPRIGHPWSTLFMWKHTLKIPVVVAPTAAVVFLIWTVILKLTCHWDSDACVQIQTSLGCGWSNPLPNIQPDMQPDMQPPGKRLSYSLCPLCPVGRIDVCMGHTSLASELHSLRQRPLLLWLLTEVTKEKLLQLYTFCEVIHCLFPRMQQWPLRGSHLPDLVLGALTKASYGNNTRPVSVTQQIWTWTPAHKKYKVDLYLGLDEDESFYHLIIEWSSFNQFIQFFFSLAYF